MTERWQGDAVEAHERSRVSAPEVSWALREVNRAAAALDHDLAERLELRRLDYTAMGHLMSAPSPLGPAELSVRLGISTGSATELVDRLERAGHLQRHRDVRDRRRVTLEPTEAAVGRVLGELRPLFASLDALAEDFTPAEQDAIARYLRAAAQAMSGYGGRPATGSARARQEG